MRIIYIYMYVYKYYNNDTMRHLRVCELKLHVPNVNPFRRTAQQIIRDRCIAPVSQLLQRRRRPPAKHPSRTVRLLVTLYYYVYIGFFSQTI